MDAAKKEKLITSNEERLVALNEQRARLATHKAFLGETLIKNAQQKIKIEEEIERATVSKDRVGGAIAILEEVLVELKRPDDAPIEE